MEFAVGYLTAIRHIARLYEVDAGWTREKCIALASGSVSVISAFFVSWSAWAAQKAARAAELGSEVSKNSLEHSIRLWTEQVAQNAELGLKDCEGLLSQADQLITHELGIASELLEVAATKLRPPGRASPAGTLRARCKRDQAGVDRP